MEANDVINKVRQAMKAAHVTQAEAAARLGVSQNNISQYLAGAPRLDTFLKLCDALQIDPANLFRQDDQPTIQTGAICPHCGKPLKITIK